MPNKLDPSSTGNLIYDLGLGASGSMVKQLGSGIQDLVDGNTQRGMEKLAPGFIRGALKANRIADEGLLTRNGAEIRPTNFYNFWKYVGQIGGLASTETAYVQDITFKAQQIEKKLMDEKNTILRDIEKALTEVNKNPTESNHQALVDAMAEVGTYNARYGGGGFIISGETITNSITGKLKNKAKSVQGLLLASDKHFASFYPLIENLPQTYKQK